MASSRIYDEAPSDVHIRAFVDRLRSSAKLDGLVAKIAFLSQPHEIGAPMIHRVVQGDPVFGPTLMRKLENAARLTENAQSENPIDSFEALGVEEARRVLALTAFAILFAVCCANQGPASQILIRSTYAISTLAGHLGANTKYTSSESAASVALNHAFGSAVMLGTYGSEYAELVSQPDASEDWFQTERSKFGVDHGDAAALLMNRFGFTLVQTEAIGKHCQPLNELKELPLLIAVSESIAQSMGIANGQSMLPADKANAWILRLGAKPDEREEWASAIAHGLSRLT